MKNWHSKVRCPSSGYTVWLMGAGRMFSVPICPFHCVLTLEQVLTLGQEDDLEVSVKGWQEEKEVRTVRKLEKISPSVESKAAGRAANALLSGVVHSSKQGSSCAAIWSLLHLHCKSSQRLPVVMSECSRILKSRQQHFTRKPVKTVSDILCAESQTQGV